MTTTVHLHVGPPKTGTTYVQRVLAEHRALLAEHGVLVVGDERADLVQAGLQVREDPRLDALPEARRTRWEALLAQIAAWPGEQAVLSYEMLAAARPEQVRRIVADLAGYDLRVVLTATDLTRVVAGAWQELVAFGLTRPLADWLPEDGDDATSEWAWRTLDPAAVAARWVEALGPDGAARVAVVTAPPRDGDPTVLWHRFAVACGLDELDLPGLPGALANASLDPAAAELLRRLAPRLTAPIDTSRERAVWVRDLLADEVLRERAGARPEAIALTGAQRRVGEERSRAAVAALQAAGLAVHGTLDDLLPAEGRGGREPADIADAELLDAALDVVRALLVRLRAAASAPAAPAPAAPPAPLPAPPVRQVRRGGDPLAERIGDLEQAIEVSRELQQRVAALEDVVTELLLPAEAADEVRIADALARYRAQSL